MSRHKQRATPKKIPLQQQKWFLPVVLGIVAVILAGGALLLNRQSRLAFTPEVTGSPRLRVDRERFDYGDVRLGTTVETVFHVQNIGDEVLRIVGEPQVELIEGC